MTQIYACDNPAGYGIHRETKKLVMTPGVCAGMTSVWCLKMAIGLPADKTKPGVAESQVIQFSYELHNKNLATLNEHFMPAARLQAKDVWRGIGNQTCSGIIQDAKDGKNHFYLWGWTGHAIGGAFRDGRFYVFNPDRGLEELDDAKTLREHMRTQYADHMKEDGWNAIEVQPDPRQMDLIVPPQKTK